MSFSFTVTTPRSDVANAVADAATRYDLGSAGDAADSTRETLNNLGALAQAHADVIGRPDDIFSISVSGHVNPDHTPRDGWANDTLTISVSQIAN